MYLPQQVAGDSVALLWATRLGLFAFSGALIYFVIKFLLEWRSGRPIYLLLSAACFALMFATKETSFITLGTMAIACVCIWAREKIGEFAARKEFPTKILARHSRSSICPWYAFVQILQQYCREPRELSAESETLVRSLPFVEVVRSSHGLFLPAASPFAKPSSVQMY